MEERKRFQNQMLNSEDYEKVEEGARALKDGGKLLGAAVLFIGVAKKYGPAIIKNINKIRKS